MVYNRDTNWSDHNFDGLESLSSQGMWHSETGSNTPQYSSRPSTPPRENINDGFEDRSTSPQPWIVLEETSNTDSTMVSQTKGVEQQASGSYATWQYPTFRNISANHLYSSRLPVALQPKSAPEQFIDRPVARSSYMVPNAVHNPNLPAAL